MTEITQKYSCYLQTILLIYFFIWKICNFFVIYIWGFCLFALFFLLFFIFFDDESECEQEENSPSLLYQHKKNSEKFKTYNQQTGMVDTFL